MSYRFYMFDRRGAYDGRYAKPFLWIMNEAISAGQSEVDFVGNYNCLFMLPKLNLSYHFYIFALEFDKISLSLV